MPKSDSLRSSIESLLSDFASQLEALVNEAAVARVMSALGGDAPAASGKRRGRPPGSGRKPGRPARGGKRSSDEVDAIAERLVAYVKSNPGQGLEAIAAGLGTSTKELKLPVIKLLAARQIKKTGQKRGTKYFPGGGRPAKAKTAKRGKKKGRRARR